MTPSSHSCLISIYHLAGSTRRSHKAPFLAAVPSELVSWMRDGSMVLRWESTAWRSCVWLIRTGLGSLPPQTVFCWFKRPPRLRGNGNAWRESRKVKKYCGSYCFGGCPMQYGAIYQWRCWNLLWDSLYDVHKQLSDPPWCQGNPAANQVTIKHMG